MHRKPGRISVTQQKLDTACWLTLGPCPALSPTHTVIRATKEICALQLIVDPLLNPCEDGVFFNQLVWNSLPNIPRLHLLIFPM